MAGEYRIFGSELSPYSVKVRSYLRYKGLAHDWLVRGPDNQEEFQRHAKLPLIPLVITPEGEGLQDSTPLIEKLEQRHPEPAIQPGDPALAFLSALVEEYADEWGNKPMFHYRWTYEADQISTADRIAASMQPDAPAVEQAALAEGIRQRMVPRLSFVGSSDQTRDQIEGAFVALLAIIEVHLGDRPYLFGGRPALADFGLFAQLYECSTDPTPGAIMLEQAPRGLAWCERMLNPTAEGEFEAWAALAPTLQPLLTEQVAGLFLPWATANAAALAAGEESFTVELEGRGFSQTPQKYHARSLGVLKQRYQAVTDRAALDPVLEATGCLAWLQS